jgi:hypothetical protein
MRRLHVVWAVVFVFCAGCGKSQYESRMTATLNNMRYRQRLDANLQPAIGEPFQAESIYLRPPTFLPKAPAFLMTAPPGLFDINESFVGSPQTASGPAGTAATPVRLHVIGRVKKTKAPATKGAPAPAPTVARGDFQTDVKNLLQNDFAVNLQELQPKKGVKKRSNAYDLLTFSVGAPPGDRQINVYFLKQDNYEIALVWDIPTPLRGASATGVDLALESFAVGRRAATAFESGGEDTGDSPSGGEAAPATTF